MKKMSLLCLAAVLIAALLTGCGTDAPASETDNITAPETTAVPPAQPAETEAPEAEALDLEALYNQGIEVLSQMGDSAPILFPETNVDYLNNFYPGLADIELKQLYAGVAPVTNAPFEIILVEVANSEDVQTVKDIFQARVDREAADTTYPENAEAWINNVEITSRDNYVFLAVLMSHCEIPAEFILD